MEYRIVYSDELYHFGIKGMKWGVRKQRPIGNGIRRTSWSQASQMARSARQQYKVDKHRTTYSTPEQARRVRRLKVARGAAIVVGSASMLAAGYLAATRTKTGRRGMAAVAKMYAKYDTNRNINRMVRAYARSSTPAEVADYKKLIQAVRAENPNYFRTIRR